MEVAVNKIVTEKRVVLEADDATEEQALAKAVMAADLAKFGITTHSPRGQELLVRLLTDQSTYTDNAFTTNHYSTYKLLVDTKAELRRDSECISEQAQRLKLTLVGADPEERLHRVMQDDAALPKNRNCATAYSVARVVRFGESHGYEQNHLRPNAWPYRDYVIKAFNDDKPFDQFVKEQLAGDQVGKGDPWTEAATGFLVAGENAGSKLARAQELGVPVLDEAGFRALLDGRPSGG
jgi:hypothetical protein